MPAFGSADGPNRNSQPLNYPLRTLSTKQVPEKKSGLVKPISRNMFLKYSGASAVAAGLIVAGCNDDDRVGSGKKINLGSGDTGILNYAYLLEQLEAAFYVKVMMAPYSGITTEETTILTEIRDHELAHRDFFKAALAGDAIDEVTFDFSSINFGNRASVLRAAQIFEDLGVSAYNGAGKLIETDAYLVLAGKIVSVEARHASAIRDLLNPFSADFAGDDVVNATNGLDAALAPSVVLEAAGAYVNANVNFSGLPS
jgi:hypothetical protein